MSHSGRPRGTVHCRQVVQSTALVGDKYVVVYTWICMYIENRTR